MAARERVKPEAGKLVDMSWDPITRIVGNLGIYTKIDFDNREVASCKSTSSLFRGYSVFMKGKDPRDAHFITSRICGICGDNHAVCSCYAQQMAYGVKPPPLGEWIVNLGRGGRVHLRPHHLPGQPGVRGLLRADGQARPTRSVLEKAEKTDAPRRRTSTATARSRDIMRSYNPFTGETYKEALQMSRIGREMICLMEGRHVHPSTIYPGGVGTVATPTLFTDYLSRLLRCLDFIKKAVAMNDDVFDFFYEALPGYEEVGRRRILLGCWGAWNNPEHVDYDYRNMDDWGNEMFVTPGVVVDGELVTTNLVDINLGIRILLGSSYYEDWVNEETFVPTRPARQPGRQAPPVEPDDDPQAAEARPRGRQLLMGDEPALVRQAHGRPPRARHRRRRARAAVGDGAGGQGRHALRQSRPGNSVLINLPKTPNTPEQTLEWKVPQWSNAIERDRARIYFVAYAAGMAMHFLDRAITELRSGRTKVFEDFDVPDEAIGCGFHEAVRGVLSHHLVIRDGKIANYHPYPPTPWNGRPTDSYGTPGPYEDAVMGQPIFEENDQDELPRDRHHAGGALLRPVPAVRRAHVPGQGQDAAQGALADVRRARLGRQCRDSRPSQQDPEPQELVARVEGLLEEVEGFRTRGAGNRHRSRAGAARPLRRGPRADRGGSPPATTATLGGALASDELVSHLLLLHGLHPVPRRGARARRAGGGAAVPASPTAATSSCSAVTRRASCGCGWRAAAAAARPRR